MIRKSGHRFSEKIMLKQKGWSAMATQSEAIALQRQLGGRLQGDFRVDSRTT
jgi:hypothetical protein